MIDPARRRREELSVGFADRSFDESSHARRVARTSEPSTASSRSSRTCCSTSSQAADPPRRTAGRRFDHPHVPALGVHAAARQGRARRDGGDELFAGYPTLQAHRLAAYYLPRAAPAARGTGRAGGPAPAGVARQRELRLPGQTVRQRGGFIRSPSATSGGWARSMRKSVSTAYKSRAAPG